MSESVVALVLLSCLLQGTGNTLQKQAVAARLSNLTVGRMLRRFPSLLRGTAANPVWLSGAALAALGSALMIQAIAQGDVTLVLPLANLTTVVSIAAGVLLLRERVARQELAGIALTLAGAVLLARSAGAPSGGSIDLSTCLVLFVSTALALGLLHLLCARSASSGREVVYAVAAGVCFGISNIFLKTATSGVQQALGHFDVADFASLRALLAEPSFHLVVACQAAGLLHLQAAYANGRISLVSPINGTLSDVLGVLLGFALLRETPSAARGLGTAVVLAGAATLLLTSRARGRGSEPARATLARETEASS